MSAKFVSFLTRLALLVTVTRGAVHTEISKRPRTSCLEQCLKLVIVTRSGQTYRCQDTDSACTLLIGIPRTVNIKLQNSKKGLKISPSGGTSVYTKAVKAKHTPCSVYEK